MKHHVCQSGNQGHLVLLQPLVHDQVYCKVNWHRYRANAAADKTGTGDGRILTLIGRWDAGGRVQVDRRHIPTPC